MQQLAGTACWATELFWPRAPPVLEGGSAAERADATLDAVPGNPKKVGTSGPDAGTPGPSGKPRTDPSITD